jgi:hypothetical protein
VPSLRRVRHGYRAIPAGLPLFVQSGSPRYSDRVRRAAWITRVLSGLAVVAASIGAAAWASAATPEPVVAHGVSKGEVHWRIRARLVQGSENARFRFAFRGCPDCGFFIGVPKPPPHSFHFNADAGSDQAGERDLAGVTDRSVTKLEVKLSDGARVKVWPRLAPGRVRAAHRWLDHFRTFDKFLYHRGDPVRVVAFDASGDKVASGRSHEGLFFG